MSVKTGALILSGGRSRRMGRDKTIVELNGETFLERAVRFWKSVPGVQNIYLSIGSSEHLEKVMEDERVAAVIREDHVIPVLDVFKDCGPMAGIHAAFLAGDEEYLYVSAIDIVNADASILPSPEDMDADACVFGDVEKVEPLFALYSRRVLPVTEQLLQEGRYKMRTLLSAVNTRYLPVSDQQRSIFLNCNTPEDLKSFSASAFDKAF